MGPGRKVLHRALHTEGSQDPRELRPDGQAALPAALPTGVLVMFDIREMSLILSEL